MYFKVLLMKYIFILIIVFNYSCQSFHDRQVPLSTERLDTIKTVPTGITAQPLLFETAFINGTTQIRNDSTVHLYGINIGNIKISSGLVTICDPILIDEYGIPFTQVFPTGEFPVQLSIARQGLEEYIAFARIKFSDEPVSKWEFALQKDQEALPVDGKDIHGFVADGGHGIFVDHEAAKVLDRKNLLSLNDSIYREMDKHNHHFWRYNIHEFNGHNLAMFTTGFGDGLYATYIGFDSSGKPCRLLTDMNIFNWKKKQDPLNNSQ